MWDPPIFKRGCVGAPQSGKLLDLRFPKFHGKGGVVKRFPWSLPAPGAWEAQGVSPRPWEAHPRGTLKITH